MRAGTLPLRTLFLLILLAGCVTGCSGEPGTCTTSKNCGGASVCVEGACVASDSDRDGDGLTAEQELAHGLSPTVADSDGDGVFDGIEWGTGADPADGDGDGVPDALESLAADLDGDCIPDSLDSNNDQADPLSSVKAAICPDRGVCATFSEVLEVECVGGVPICKTSQLSEYQPTETWCDGLDNDCDGSVDEGIHVAGKLPGEVCVAAGTCGEGIVECNPSDREAICSSGPGGSAEGVESERCDGLDNDCDGTVDNGMSFEAIALGEECEGYGLCGPGVVQCRASDGIAICSTMQGGDDDEAEEETCDGLDNDCDGTADEGLFSPDLSSCPSQGVCDSGKEALKVICDAGAWICDPSDVPGYTGQTDALCDGLDNDCDGVVDEEFQLTDFDGSKKELESPCGTGPCGGGIVVCSEDGTGAICSTWTNVATELCDGLDNDCDGAIDEEQTYMDLPVGESCKGLGQCGIGTVECSEETMVAVCSANSDGSGSQASPELCDQLDNDCDGDADEGITGQPGCALPGVCQDFDTEAACVLGEWVCEYAFLPGWEAQETTCDDLDNDCDGYVDEKLPKEFAGGAVEVWSGSPAARADAAHLANLAEGRVWLSGGRAHAFPWPGTETCLSEVWQHEFSSGEWQQLLVTAWPGRHDHSMAWLPEPEELLAIGGRCNSEVIADGWRIVTESGVAIPVAVPAAVADRYGHVLLADEESGALLIVGGITGAGLAAPTFVLGDDLQPTEELPAVPKVAFPSHCVDHDHGVVWFFGGHVDGELSNSLWNINMATFETTAVPANDGPQPRRGALLACGESLMLFGGTDAGGDLLGDFWQFDIEAETWAPGPALPPLRQQSLGAVVEEDLYLVGGLGEEGLWLPDSWRFESGDWVELSEPGPGSLAGAAHALDPVGRRMCVVGGFATGAAGPVANYQLWCRALKDGVWSALGEPLTVPAIFSTLSYDPNAHRFLLVGGGGFASGGEPQLLSPICRFDYFDLTTSSWGTFASCNGDDQPGPLAAHAAAVRWKDLSLWVYGGLGSDGLSSQLWRYGLDTEIWQEMVPAEGDTLPGRYGHQMWIREELGELLVMGSASSSGAAFRIELATLEVSSPISVPGWFDFGFAPGLYDGDGEAALLVHPSGTQATQIVLEGGLLVDGGVTTLAETISGSTHAAAFYDRWRRVGLLYGGLDQNGLTRSDLARINMVCE